MFSENLKRYRLQSGMTQAQAAAKLGIARVSYTRYELGTHAPNIALLPSIAQMYCCRIDDLFSGGEESAKASAQTLLTESASETAPWDCLERDLDDLLE